MSHSDPAPFEWFMVVARCRNVSYLLSDQRLERLLGRFDDLVDTEENDLFWGSTEWILGISAEEADLRLAESLARKGARPDEVFAHVRHRWAVRQRDDRCPEPMPSDRYFDRIVYVTFQKLFAEALADGSATIPSWQRVDELYEMLHEDEE